MVVSCAMLDLGQGELHLGWARLVLSTSIQ